MDQRPPLTNKLPRVGVSACLAGQRVRYDGASRPSAALAALQDQVELWNFCPEVRIGLGVPRPPIQIVEIDGARRVRGVAAPHRDVTAALAALVRQLPDDLCGFILKARSPSCGLGTTPIYRADIQIDTGDGAFAAALRQRFPDLPLIDEEALVTIGLRSAFIDAVRCRYRRKSAPR